MCYTCGCMMPDNPHDKGHAGADLAGRNVTDRTFTEAATAMELADEAAKRNAYELLKKIMGERRSRVTKDSSGFDRYDDAPQVHHHPLRRATDRPDP